MHRKCRLRQQSPASNLFDPSEITVQRGQVQTRILIRPIVTGFVSQTSTQRRERASVARHRLHLEWMTLMEFGWSMSDDVTECALWGLPYPNRGLRSRNLLFARDNGSCRSQTKNLEDGPRATSNRRLVQSPGASRGEASHFLKTSAERGRTARGNSMRRNNPGKNGRRRNDRGW